MVANKINWRRAGKSLAVVFYINNNILECHKNFYFLKWMLAGVEGLGVGGLLTAEGNPRESALPEDFKKARLGFDAFLGLQHATVERVILLLGQCGVDPV